MVGVKFIDQLFLRYFFFLYLLKIVVKKYNILFDFVTLQIMGLEPISTAWKAAPLPLRNICEKQLKKNSTAKNHQKILPKTKNILTKNKKDIILTKTI